MFKFKSFLTLVLVLLIGFSVTNAQDNARLQVIHNAADPAAEKVDVYLNGQLLLNDFAFRTATPFIDAPANVELEIGVAPGTSSSASDVLASFKVTLMAGKKYVAIANGVLNPVNFASNPDGKSTAFTLFIKENAQEAAATTGSVEFAVLHGSTDAPTVDILARDVAKLVDDAPYGALTDYLSVPPADYTIDITDASGSVVVATYTAPLSGLANGAAIVFASGFFNPAANQNGKAFGVFAALPDGTVLELPAVTTARLQVIHNAADPAAEKVDIYVSESLLLDDFAFKAATPFIDVPANTDLKVGVAPGTSSSAADVIANFQFNLSPGQAYIAIANGVLSPGEFVANPDGKNTGFNIFVKPMAREKGTSNNVDFFILHGSTDAPGVDVVVGNGQILAQNLMYSDMTDYISVPASKYLIYLKTPGPSKPFIAFDVNLTGLDGGAAVVMASGFLNKDGNKGGKGFELIGVLPNGQVVVFPDPTPSSIERGTEVNQPLAFSLDQNYPNPFNPTTTISFSLPESRLVKLSIYNVLGQEVFKLVDQNLSAGQYKYQFDAKSLESGVYYYKIQAGDYTSIRKMTLLK